MGRMTKAQKAFFKLTPDEQKAIKQKEWEKRRSEIAAKLLNDKR